MHTLTMLPKAILHIFKDLFGKESRLATARSFQILHNILKGFMTVGETDLSLGAVNSTKGMRNMITEQVK